MKKFSRRDLKFICGDYDKTVLYPMDFKMHRDGKEVNPREHSELCDRGECSQQRAT
ncbi:MULTISPECIES: hypothetical protein [Photorhabdus]|uniref:hypothetical protein n=1 Tax=Photorhabdus TaxID=29487 RepID=UPI0030D7EADA